MTKDREIDLKKDYIRTISGSGPYQDHFRTKSGHINTESGPFQDHFRTKSGPY